MCTRVSYIICIAIANQTTTEKCFSIVRTRNPIIPITLTSVILLRTLLLRKYIEHLLISLCGWRNRTRTHPKNQNQSMSILQLKNQFSPWASSLIGYPGPRVSPEHIFRGGTLSYLEFLVL